MSYTDLDPPNAAMGSRGAASGDRYPWFARAEDWLDDRGKGAWIALVILGLIFVWPVGLALLAYMIWSKRMFRGSCGHGAAHRRDGHMQRWAQRHGIGRGMGRGYASSGNLAFDSYKADTLRRLEEEQEAFEAFLQRLRDAKDKSEFDAFMDDRAARARGRAEGEGDEPTQG